MSNWCRRPRQRVPSFGDKNQRSVASGPANSPIKQAERTVFDGQNAQPRCLGDRSKRLAPKPSLPLSPPYTAHFHSFLAGKQQQQQQAALLLHTSAARELKRVVGAVRASAPSGSACANAPGARKAGVRAPPWSPSSGHSSLPTTPTACGGSLSLIPFPASGLSVFFFFFFLMVI